MTLETKNEERRAAVTSPQPILPTAEGKYKKILVTGHIIEVYEYRDYPPQHWKLKKKKDKPKFIAAMEAASRVDREEEKVKYSMSRRRSNIRRLANANFTAQDKFVTLTFRDGATMGKGRNKKLIEVKNIESTNKAFDHFMKRLKRLYGNDLKYIAVIEFQDENGRGAVHYHMMINLPYVPHNKLTELWGYGFVGINRMDKVANGKDVDNVGAYLTAYMMKDLDERLKGKKAYNYSRNLIHPKELTGEEAQKLFDFLKEKNPVFSKVWGTEYMGLCEYTEFNLNRT